MESVTIIFDRSKMTGRWERALRKAVADDDAQQLLEAIAHVFISWDVTDEQGALVPVTSDLLLDLPGTALIALIEGMMQASAPTSEEGNDSSATSPSPSTGSTQTQASPQNGPQPSPSPELSTSASLK